MKNPATRVLSAAIASAFAAGAAAQGPDLLLTFALPETTLSGSAGTPLMNLRPNEVVHLEWSNGPCANPSAEKYVPRTCFHVMAGDEDSDAMYWNPTIFGSIDALCAAMPTTPIAGVNPRTFFWSPSAAMGTGVSAPVQLRPGDVGRIVRNGAGDGQVEYFLSQDQVNQAMGLPLNNVLDVDAVAYTIQDGVFFSLDQDTVATVACGPVFVRDGDILCIPAWAITWTPDFRVAGVMPGSAIVVHSELQVDAMVLNAAVADRFGGCVPNAVDVESLEIDWSGPTATFFPCPGAVGTAPTLIFSTETTTGGSLLTTAGGGSIWTGTCGPVGTPCGSGPTWGNQIGIAPASSTVGAPSHVTGLLATFTMRYTMQARTPVLNSAPSGLPAGATLFDLSSPAALNFVFVTFAPAGVNAVPASFPGFPWSLFAFPDYYPVNFFYMFTPTVGGFATFPSFAIPPNFPVKLLFQSVGIVNGLVEFSTPAMLDVL